MTDHLYRVLITEYPEGSMEPGWEPPDWPDAYPDAPVGADTFTWPSADDLYLSRSGAQRRRRLVESYGAKAVVEKSEPVTWPEGEAETVTERPVYVNAALQILGEPPTAGARVRITDPTLITPSEKLLEQIGISLGDIALDAELSRVSLTALLQLFKQFTEGQNQLIDGLRKQLGRSGCGRCAGSESGGLVGVSDSSAEIHESSPCDGVLDSTSVGEGSAAVGVSSSAPAAVAEPSWMDRPDAVVLHADGKLTWLSGGGHCEMSDLVADQIPEAVSSRFRPDDPYLFWFQDGVGLPLNPLADLVIQELDQIKQSFGWRGDVVVSRFDEQPLTVADCELIESLHVEHTGGAA